MSYKAFALKYRPQDFEGVVGQENVVVSLRTAIERQHIHHAYLFSGPRGVGKTSLARILAKALNCQSFDKPTTKPCLNCTSCKEITQGSSLDVIEIDGASNRGIDEIRQLRENVKFSPSYARFKVYIIDEVHQITHDAFNALLKTLEEPPSHVKFIFATTNPNKVPVTILSRCQRFNFGLLPQDKIIDKLKFIAGNENIAVNEEIINHISQAGLGSIRDAESIFDQIAPLIVEGGNLNEILDILGQVPQYELTSFVEHLLQKNAGDSLKIINSIIEEGQDLNNFLTSVIEYIRNVMLARLGENLLARITDLPDDLRKKVIGLSKKSEMVFLLRAVDLFIEAKKLSKFLPSLRIPLEVAVVKLTYKEEAPVNKESAKDTKKEKHQEESREARKEFGFQHKTASLNLENVSRFVDSLKSGFRGKADKQEEKGHHREQASVLDIAEVHKNWEQILEDISNKKMAVATYLKGAKILDMQGVVLNIGVPKNLAFSKEFLQQSERKQFVEDIIEKILGKRVNINYVLTDTVEEPRNTDSSRQAINNIIETFGGEVVT